MARSLALAFVVGGGLFAFLFLPDFLDGRIFAYRDAGYYHLPVSRLVSGELRAGRIPFWNPTIACGTPLAANPNNYVWYPSRLLELVMSPEAALSVHFFAHWIAGGVAMAALAAALGLSFPATTVAGALYLLAGPVLSLLNFANLAPFLFWAPATMLAVLRLLRRPNGRSAAVLALCLAVQTAFVEPSLLLAEVLATVAVAAAAAPYGGKRSRAALWAAAAAGVALLLAAPMWIPMSELVATSARAADTRATQGLAVAPVGLLQLAVPQFFGDYHTLEKLRYWGEVFQQGKGPFFLSLSFGVAALALAVAGGVARPRATLPLLAAAVLGVLLAMGQHFAPFRALASSEGAGLFRWPVKFTFVTALTLPLCAATGLSALARAESARRAAWTAAVTAFLLGAFLLVLARGAAGAGGWLLPLVAPLGELKDVPGILGDVHGRLLRASVFAGVVTLAAVAAAWLCGRAGFAVTAILAAVLVAELAPPQRRVNRGMPVEVLRVDTPVLREARALADDGFRVLFPRHNWDAAIERTPGLPDEWWPHARLDRELGNFYHPIGENIPTVLLNPDRLVTTGAAARARYHPLLSGKDQRSLTRLIGVKGEVKIGLPALATDRRPYATSAGFPVLVDIDPEAVPIAAWLPSLPDLSGLDPWNGPFLRRAFDHVHTRTNPDAVRIVGRRPGRWDLAVTADRDGWIALTETRDPGWRARVDGESVAIRPYLRDFLAVGVPAGTHRVELSYRPRRFSLWLAASVAGWILIPLLLFARRRPS